MELDKGHSLLGVRICFQVIDHISFYNKLYLSINRIRFIKVALKRNLNLHRNLSPGGWALHASELCETTSEKGRFYIERNGLNAVSNFSRETFVIVRNSPQFNYRLNSNYCVIYVVTINSPSSTFISKCNWNISGIALRLFIFTDT